MRSKKLIKSLAAFAVGIIMACSFASAACNKGGNKGGSGHTHVWGKWVAVDATTHKRECTIEGCTQAPQTGKHNTSGAVGSCSDCGYNPNGDTPIPTDKVETSAGYKKFLEEAGSNLVYKNSFDNVADVPFGNAISADGAKVYGSVNNNQTGYLNGGMASIKNGDLAVENAVEGYSVFAHIVLDQAIEDKKVTVRFEYKVDSEIADWTHLALYSGANEIISLRTTSSTTLGYKIANFSDAANSYISIAADTKITVGITLDFVAGTVAVKGASGNSNLATIPGSTSLEVGATRLSEIKFGTAVGASSIYVSNVAIKAETVSVEDYAAIYNEKVAGYHARYAQYTKEDSIKAFIASVEAAKEEYDRADKSTIQLVDTAYTAYVNEMVALLRYYGVELVQVSHNADGYADVIEDYKRIINKLKDDLSGNNLTTIEAVWTLIDAANAALDALHNDTSSN